jgi:hypothetical protein
MSPPPDPYADAPLGSWLTRLFWPLWERDISLNDVLYTVDVVIWIAVIVALGALGVRGVRTSAREGRLRLPLALGALFIAGLGLRWSLATFGPGDLWVNQAAAFTAVYRGLGLPPYGGAPVALIRLAFAVFGESYSLLIWVGLITGAAAPVVLVLALRRLGRGEVEAWVGGALLALHPLAVRFAGEGNRGAQVVFLFCLCLFAFASWLARERRGWLALGVAAALLMCHSRPEAIMGLVPLATLGLWKAPTWRHRGELVVAGLLVVGFVVAQALHPSTVLQTSAGNLPYQYMRLFPPFSPETAFWVDPVYVGFGLLVLTGFGAVLGILELDPLPTSAVLGLLVISYLTQSEPSGDLNLANVRYQMLAIPCAVLASAYAVSRVTGVIPRPRARAAVAALAVVGIGATMVRPLREVTAATTVDEEFHFVRALIEELPPNAQILAPYDPLVIELGMRPLGWVMAVTHPGGGGGWTIWDPREPLPDVAGPRYYYHSASCSGRIAQPDARTDELMAQCAAGLASYGESPMRVAVLGNRPMAYEFYTDPIVVGLYAIDD